MTPFWDPQFWLFPISVFLGGTIISTGLVWILSPRKKPYVYDQNVTFTKIETLDDDE